MGNLDSIRYFTRSGQACPRKAVGMAPERQLTTGAFDEAINVVVGQIVLDTHGPWVEWCEQRGGYVGGQSCEGGERFRLALR
jgi:hypothetical protein